MEIVNIPRKFSLFTEHWRPKIIAELNGQELKIVKIKGEFPWHAHDVDEMFITWEGKFLLETKERSYELNAGEIIVIPAGVEHRPVADEEALIFLLEPAGVRNTGDLVDPIFTAPDGVRI